MQSKVVTWALALLLGLAAFPVADTIWHRYSIEHSYRTVGVFVDLRDIYALSEISGRDPDRLLSDFERLGANGLAVQAGDGSAFLSVVKSRQDLSDENRYPLVAVMLPAGGGVSPQEVHELLSSAFDMGVKIPFISFTDEEPDLFSYPPSDERLHSIVGGGKSGWAVFAGDAGQGQDYIQAGKDPAAGSGDPQPQPLSPEWEVALGESDLSLGRVEFVKVTGEADLADNLGARIIRVHTIPRREVRVYSLTKSVERYLRAVRERNYRALWVRLILPETADEVTAGADTSRWNQDREPYGYYLGVRAAEPVNTPQVSQGGGAERPSPVSTEGLVAAVDGDGLLELNYALVGRTVEALQAAGYTIGEPDLLPAWSNGWIGIFGSLLAGGLAVFALLRFTGASFSIAAALALVVFFAGILLFTAVDPVLGRQAAAFLAANSFAALAVTRAFTFASSLSPGLTSDVLSRQGVTGGLVLAFCRGNGAFILQAFAGVGRAAAISLAGGLVVATALGDYRFMLKTHQFLGVKVSLLLPLVWNLGFVFLWDEKRRRLCWPLPGWSSAAALLKRWRSWQVAGIAVLVLLAVAMYLARSANFVLPVPEVEVWLRTTLERLLIARPRTKEFLIGHPLLMFGLFGIVSGVCTNLGRAAVVAGSVASVSIVNTFSHIHTPLYLGILRTVYGWIMGTVLGILLIIGFIGLLRLKVVQPTTASAWATRLNERNGDRTDTSGVHFP